MNRKLVLSLFFIILSISLVNRKLRSSDIQVQCEPLGLNIDTKAEYGNGTIPGEPLDIWYVWINVSDTQIIYYALTSEEFNPPVKNFLGQHFQVENETEIFIGNVMALIEVYNDTNEDGIPQANFTSGQSEIAFYLLVNSSISFEPTPVQKIMEDETAHYKWGFRYDMIDGFLQYADSQNTGARVMIDYLGFKYDFYITQNTSHLKTSIEIGNVTNIEPWQGEPPISLDNLSLSILFSTAASAAKQHTTYVNGQPFNSTKTTDSATKTDNSQIAVEMTKAYEFLFGENYNLTRGEIVETYMVKAVAAATSSIPEGAKTMIDWAYYYFENNLNITELFPSAEGIGGKLNLDYDTSSFLYRICYPTWEGLPIEHDPTYVAYLHSTIIIPELDSIIAPLLLITFYTILIGYHLTGTLSTKNNE